MNPLTHHHVIYPRYFVRLTAVSTEVRIAETAEDAAQYTVDAGWQEYGPLLSGERGAAQAGHTMGLSAEGEAK